MRSLLSAVAAFAALSAAPGLVKGDATIRYRIETASPLPQVPGTISSSVIYMKGNKGATVTQQQTTIVDFARQEVTIMDPARKKYATFPASEYGSKMGANIASIIPMAGSPMVADMLKSLKTTCDTKNTEAAESIQGMQTEERDVTCSMTMSMPENMKQAMPGISIKMSMRTWSAAPGERVRVPGLWQLSGFELWQNYFMNPAGALGNLMPEGMKPMIDAMQKDRSATLRMSMEVSMNLPMPGLPPGDKPLVKITQEVVGLSTDLLDDAVFSVPAEYSAEPFDAVMKGITDAALASAKASAPKPQ